MPEERKIQLPDPKKAGKSYVLSQAFVDKLKQADLGYLVTPRAEDFTVEKGGGEMKFSIDPNGPAFTGSSRGNGALIFVDCDSAEVARIEWINGIITTTGEQTVEAGCSGGSTGSAS